ncbi:hypothetical protein M8J75_016336 [Diaphorina citri]|nr:hypothetical protein M8J75_016336 [Diaphorina citri]
MALVRDHSRPPRGSHWAVVPAVLQTSSRWRLIPVTVSPIGESLPSSPAFSKERTWKKRYLDGILCI